MLQDRENVEFLKHLCSYSVAFAFTSTRVQNVGFKLGSEVHIYKVQGGFYHLIGGMELVERQLPCFRPMCMMQQMKVRIDKRKTPI
jgi:hypothetical protein